MGAAEVQAVCENGAPMSQTQSALRQPPMSTQRNRLGSAYTLSLSHRFILTQKEKSGKQGKKVTSAVFLAANVYSVQGWEYSRSRNHFGWRTEVEKKASKALLGYWQRQFGRSKFNKSKPRTLMEFSTGIWSEPGCLNWWQSCVLL